MIPVDRGVTDRPRGWRRWSLAPGTLAVALLVACRPSTPAEAPAASAPPPDGLSVPSWETPLLAAAGGLGLDSAVALLDRGRQLLAEGEPGEAARLFALAGTESHSLSDWAGLLEARALAEAGEPNAMERVLARLPPDLDALLGWDARVRLHRTGGRPEEALGAARTALGALAERGARSRLELVTAKLELSLGDTTGARETLIRSLAPGAPARVAAEAAAHLEDIATGEPEALFALFEHHLRRGDLREARRLANLLAHTPGVPPTQVARAQLLEAVALARRRNEESLTARILALGREAPDAELRSDAWLAAGRIRLGQGRTGDARTNLARAVDAAPDGAATQEALFLLADLDQDAGGHASARELFRRARALDPASEWGGEAAARLGVLLYQDGDDLGAAAVFEGYRETHPEGWRFQQATFWAGMAYRRMGERATAQLRFLEAEAVDPVGYYGMRGRRVGGGALGVEGIGEGPLPDSATGVLSRGGLLRVEALRRAGLADDAEVERTRLHRLMASLPGGLHSLGEAYHASGRLLDAVRTGREARRLSGRWDLRLLRVVYPLPFAEEIERHAAREGLDPALLAALIRQESLFQPHAVSPAGAAGLMQMRPPVAGEVALGMGVPPPSAAQLQDPELNLLLGSRHLASLIVRYDQRVDEVLVAYNAGPARLARWRSFPEHPDPDQFLERIPYRETREYVRVVLESVPVYQALYWTGPAEPTVTSTADR